jgi:pyrimidine deaminase RibD-like protein
MPDKSFTEMEFMQLAIAEAHKSRSGDFEPKVGAVIARGGHLLATGFRGEIGEGKGMHAEASALSKIRHDVAAEATIFTTLEPCTKRTRERMPCTDLLINLRIKCVYLGILDPNQDICGRGESRLEEANIEVRKFNREFVQSIRAMNVDFIKYESGLGISIDRPKPGDVIESPSIELGGSFRMRPRPGDRVLVFVRQGVEYFPQAPISYDIQTQSWSCKPVWIEAKEDLPEAEIFVARISEDLEIARNHYSDVSRQTSKWIGLKMPTRPPGFETLASVAIRRPWRKS